MTKKNKKIIVAVIVAILAIFIILSCIFISKFSASVEKKPEKEFKSQNLGVSYDADIISNFTINGTEHTLPEITEDFLGKEWEFCEQQDAEMILYGRCTATVSLNLSGAKDCRTTVSVMNCSMDSHPISKCMIYEIEFPDDFVKRSGAEITLCRNKFKISETNTEQVKSILGVATRVITEEKNTILRYDSKLRKDKNKLRTTFCFNNDVLSSVKIKNKLIPEEYEQLEVKEQAPSFLNEYKAPSELGDDIISGNFSLNGDLYNLPAPLKEFINNGWSYTSEPDNSIAAQITTRIPIRKDDSCLFVEIYNPLPTATTIDNSIVVGIFQQNDPNYQHGGANFELILPQNIKLGTNREEVFDIVKNLENVDHVYSHYHEYIISFNTDSQEQQDYLEIYFNSNDDDEFFVSGFAIERYNTVLSE